MKEHDNHKTQSDDFVDYYDMLQISPDADQSSIQRVYHMLAARFHPDNPETGDVELFLKLSEAYKVLGDRANREGYDKQHRQKHKEPLKVFSLKEFSIGVGGESSRRLGVLGLLYNQRRVNPEGPGLSILDLETRTGFPREHLLFALWYLRDKKYLRHSENSDLEITAAGVDFLESNLPENPLLHRLLHAAPNDISGSPNQQDSTPPA